MKRFLSAIVLAVLVSVTNVTPVQGIVSFNDAGLGIFTNELDSFDWKPGGTLGDNLNQAVRNFLGGSGSTEFDFFYQAQLGTYSARPLGGGPLDDYLMPTGKELTLLMGMRQQVVDVSGSDVKIDFVGAADMFLEVYYGTKNADLLAGTGFNDGSLILQASITGTDEFVLSMGTPNQTVALDQYGSDDFPGVLTTIMNGQTTVRARVDQYDPLFFDIDPDSDEIRVTISNYGTGTPFVTGDPSSQFVLSRNLSGIGFSGTAPTLSGAGSTIGPINGDYLNEEYMDSVFGTDTSSIFKTEDPRSGGIPEPTMLTLGAMALNAIGLFALRRRRTSAS